MSLGQSFFKFSAILCVCFGFLMTAVVSNSAAHTVFKKALEKEYTDVKASCNACHVKGEKKSARNDFGALFYEETKDLKLTETWKEKKGKEKKEYQKEVMIPAFEKALAVVKEQKKDDKTYDELIKAAELDGLKLKEKDDDE